MRQLNQLVNEIICWSILIFFVGCSENINKFEKHDPLIWEARLAYEDGAYEKALTNFQEAFKIIDDDSAENIFLAAAAALRLEKDEVADALIRRAIKKKNPKRNYYTNFYGFTRFKDKPLFAAIEKDYEQLVVQYYKNLPYPKEIVEEIEEMVKKDQEPRLANKEWSEIAKVDSVNIARLIEITKQYGWIDKAWIILWHQRGTYGENNEVWNYFKPFFDKEMAEGRRRKDFWVMFDEEKSIINSKTQNYGGYLSQFEQFPINDIDNIDKRRAEKGMPPLWYLQKVYGQTLPPNYKWIEKIKG